MTRTHYIKTTEIDLAAAIMALTEIRPALFPGRNTEDLVEIVFPATEELLVPVQQLLVFRKTLAVYVREVKRLYKGVEL